MKQIKYWFIAAVLVWSLAVGCSTSKPSNFYLLTSAPEVENDVRLQTNVERPLVGVGPVKIPAYLDRPQIVARSGAHRLELAEFDRWAEPLKDSLTRVLIENLSAMLQADAVDHERWNAKRAVDYQVAVAVTRFDRNAQNAVVLIAQWHVLDGPTGDLLAIHKSTISAPVRGTDYAALASAESGVLQTLSRQIGDVVTGLSR
jgi:uncharacterized lipoprotein YmbA